MSYCEFCGKPTPDEFEIQRFGKDKAQMPQNNWWACFGCVIANLDKPEELKKFLRSAFCESEKIAAKDLQK